MSLIALIDGLSDLDDHAGCREERQSSLISIMSFMLPVIRQFEPE